MLARVGACHVVVDRETRKGCEGLVLENYEAIGRGAVDFVVGHHQVASDHEKNVLWQLGWKNKRTIAAVTFTAKL